jgi:hypothetical protein
MTTNQQLELGFDGIQSRLLGRRENRVARAQWWFAQMRAAVAGAMEWPADSQRPAEPLLFNGASREVETT